MAEDAFACPVCLDVFVNPVTIFPCGHSTCAHCLEHWSDRGNSRCPTCTTTMAHAVLSFALRTATEAVHGDAVIARRSELGLDQHASFSRVFASPYNFRNILRVFRGDAAGLVWTLLLSFGVVGAGGYYTLTRSDTSTASLLVTIISAVVLSKVLHHFGVQEVIDAFHMLLQPPPPAPHVHVHVRDRRPLPRIVGDLMGDLLAAGVAVLEVHAGQPPGADAAARPAPLQARAEAGAAPVRRPAGIRALYALFVIWLVLFCIFFVLISRQLAAEIEHAENAELAGDGEAASNGSDFGKDFGLAMAAAFRATPAVGPLIAQVFVVTFAVVFVSLMTLQLLPQLAAHVRQ